MSDAECNEGSLWEAAMFAAHHRLANLVAVVDVNGQQALGYTRGRARPRAARDRWRGFGWDAHEVDGHDAAALRGGDRAARHGGRPPARAASRAPSSARASRSWSARSSGTTCRCPTQQYAQALARARGERCEATFAATLAELADARSRASCC